MCEGSNGSMRKRLADAIFSRTLSQHVNKMNRIILEIQHSVVSIRPGDGKTSRYENSCNCKLHHNRKSNL